MGEGARPQNIGSRIREMRPVSFPFQGIGLVLVVVVDGVAPCHAVTFIHTCSSPTVFIEHLLCAGDILGGASSLFSWSLHLVKV